MNFLLFPTDHPTERLPEPLRPDKEGVTRADVRIGQEPYRLLLAAGHAGQQIVDLSDSFGCPTWVGGNYVLSPGAAPANLTEWLDAARGHFTAFQQAEPDTLLVVTDAVNSTVPYCVIVGARYVLSSRLDWLALFAGIRLTWNYDAMHSLVFGNMQLARETLFREVTILPDAATTRLERPDRLSSSKWWAPDFADSRRQPSVDDVIDVMRDAAATWHSARPKATVSLTGGQDSRTTLAVFADVTKRSSGELHAATMGNRHAHDVYLARAVADRAGATYHELNYDLQRDILPECRRLESEDPWWLRASGQARHSFVYMAWFLGQLQRLCLADDVNSHGVGPCKGFYHRQAKQTGDIAQAITLEVRQHGERPLAVGAFAGRARESLAGLADYFAREGLRELPDGLDLLRQADWFGWYGKVVRQWAPRLHFLHQTGGVFFPLLERDFVALTTAFPTAQRSEGHLLSRITQRIAPELGTLPCQSGLYRDRFRPSLAWKIRAGIARNLLGRPIREPASAFELRPTISEPLQEALRRVCQCLPSLAPLLGRLQKNCPFFDVDRDFRFYSAIRFGDDLIRRSVDIVEE